MKRFLTIVVLLFGLSAGSMSAQMMGPGYGNGGYGRGYGGMMGSSPWPGQQQLTLEQATRLLDARGPDMHVDKAKNEVVYSGDKVSIVMAAVQPGFPDTTFEVAGLVNPTIVVPSGAEITVTLVNMDYGTNMDHGVAITPIGPPYPIFGMMGMPNTVAGIPVLAPRSAENGKTALYPEASITFPAGQPGRYYYICQYYDHASKGMYGTFIVK